LFIVIYIDLQVKMLHGHFLTLGSLFATSIGNPINMNTLLSWPTPTGLQPALAQRDRPTSVSESFAQRLRPPLPQCKTLSLRRESTKRSAYVHPSQKSLSLARPSRKTMRYRLGFLWGLWLPVAVQNIICNSPQRMPSAERSFIASCPTQAAGAIT
jgi:hypothetical protein